MDENCGSGVEPIFVVAVIDIYVHFWVSVVERIYGGGDMLKADARIRKQVPDVSFGVTASAGLPDVSGEDVSVGSWRRTTCCDAHSYRRGH